MKRKPMSRKGSKKVFSRTASKEHPKNHRPPSMRGGYRL